MLYRYVRPVLQQMVRDRQDTIQQQVDASEEATRRLPEAEQRFERAEAEARKEIAKIRDDARADATSISEELQEQAEREVERIRQRGQEQLAAQRDQMVRGLRAELGAQAMRLAEQIVVDAAGRRHPQERHGGQRSWTISTPWRARTEEPAVRSDGAQLTASAGGVS